MYTEMTTILHGESELRSALIDTSWHEKAGLERYKVASDFLAGIRTEIESAGKYPYNDTITDLTVQRLNITVTDALKTLVYNTQCWVSDKARSDAGWVTLTQELIDLAYEQKAKIETQGDFINNVYNVRQIGGKNYAMKPHASKRALAVAPWVYARIIKQIASCVPNDLVVKLGNSQ